ncbi:unnamed protein product [Candida verbasci]|uniref:Uncharacterized protein n=1 Tax=Candida verbasci TaxID=1227364 RepID=A0A9W4TW16_9ASCO|nr:unnamed protein product [Candida verbasci]
MNNQKPKHPAKLGSHKGSSTNLTRPNLNRSKSTDGLIRRNNSALKRNGRSFTKINGLQPLTKTLSNPSIKCGGTIGLKTSAKKGKAILSLNDDDGDFEDVNEPADKVKGPVPERFDQTSISSNSNREPEVPSLYNNLDVPTPFEENKKLEVVEEHTNTEPARPDLISTKSSDDDFSSNLYGGSLLLSQSTGLIKKIEKDYGPEEIKYSDSISGISFKANPIENIAKPITTNKNVVKDNSYEVNKTIYSNLQRSFNKNESKNSTPLNNPNNFSDFLKPNHSSSSDLNNNLETRTQQRLWLQRESSLMDVTNLENKSNFSNLSLNNLMFSHSYSNHNLSSLNSTTNNDGHPSNNNMLMHMVSTQNSIQSRTEFERLNREYLNVRRHTNPIGESLNRVDQYLHKDELRIVKTKKTETENLNSFKEFSPSAINKIWQDAVIATSSKSNHGQRAFQRPATSFNNTQVS